MKSQYSLLYNIKKKNSISDEYFDFMIILFRNK